MLQSNERIKLFKELECLDPRNSPAPSWMEMPTPHKMAVTLLVQVYIDKNVWKQGAFYKCEPLYRKNFCMLLLKLIHYPDMSYADMYQLLTSPCYSIDPSHLERFEKTLARLSNHGVEEAFEFAEIPSIDAVLAEEAAMSQYSLVGLYMRRVAVVLQRMNFVEKLKLHENFCNYYNKGLRALAIGPFKLRAFMYNEEDCTSTSNSCSSSCTLDEPFTSATMDCEDCSGDAGTGAVSRTSIFREQEGTPYGVLPASRLDLGSLQHDRQIMSKWSEKQAELFVLQQCQLLETNELRALAPIELHKKILEIIEDNPLLPHVYYLDYMNQIRIGDYTGAVDALHRAFDRCPVNMMRSEQLNGFHYFSLNMTKLQAHFGHTQEALVSLQECVMLAQESGDELCLELANSWHTLLNNAEFELVPKNETELEDTVLADTYSLALLNQVINGVARGALPLNMFGLLFKSEEINSQHNLIQRNAEVLALRSTLWHIYGCSELSALYAQMVMYLEKTWLFGDVSNVSSVCNALANIARHLHAQGAKQLSQTVLNHVRSRFGRPPGSKIWMSSNLINCAESCIYRCAWNEAEHHISQLYLFEPIESLLLTLTMALARKNWKMANYVLRELQSEKQLSLEQYVHMLILKAFSYKLAPTGLRQLLEASQLTLSHHLFYEHACVEIAMAVLMLNTGMPTKAHQVCMNAIGRILQSGSLYARTMALFAFMRCRLAITVDVEQQRELLLRSLSTQSTLLQNFRQLQAHGKVLDVLTYFADIYDKLDNKTMRNKYANQFCQYQREFPQAVGNMNVSI